MGSRWHFIIDDSSGPRALFQCLGDPGGADDAFVSIALFGSDNVGDIVDVYGDRYFADGDSDSDVPPGGEQ